LAIVNRKESRSLVIVIEC